jgi:hypothetical protein
VLVRGIVRAEVREDGSGGSWKAVANVKGKRAGRKLVSKQLFLFLSKLLEHERRTRRRRVVVVVLVLERQGGREEGRRRLRLMVVLCSALGRVDC